jgi:hypothetical protein
MSRQLLVSSVALLMVVACERRKEEPLSDTPVAAPAAALPAASQTATRRAAATVTGRPELGAPTPVVIEPALPALEKDSIHARPFGWAKDSSDFGYCVESGAARGMRCVFERPQGEPETLRAGDARQTSAIEARLAEKAYSPDRGKWPHDDVALTWKSDVKGGAAFRVGAHVKGASEPVWPITIQVKASARVHPEAIAVSPNMKYVGVLAHVASESGAGTFEVRVMPVATLLGQAFQAAGLEAHARADYRRAADLFGKATLVDGSLKSAVYDHARALARLKDPAARTVLAAAIARGGSAIRQKALDDPDFEGVRGEEWFGILTR